MFHSVKVQKGMEVKSILFLTLAVDGGEWQTDALSAFNSEERASVPTGSEVERNPESSWMTTTITLIQFNSFIYVLDNSQKWPITAKHKIVIIIIIIIINIAPQWIRTQTHLTISRVIIPLSYQSMLNIWHQYST
jgi:hypothetical protein